MPGTGGTQRLARLVGRSRAIELMVEGTKLGITDALEEGIVNKVFEAESPEAFIKQVVAYAHRFCAPAGAPLAVGRIKRAVQSGLDGSLEQGLALERELQAQLFVSNDAKEGFAAFAEKRKPSFRGR